MDIGVPLRQCLGPQALQDLTLDHPLDMDLPTLGALSHPPHLVLPTVLHPLALLATPVEDVVVVANNGTIVVL